MGEAKLRMRTFAEMLANSKGCIYCAGQNTATTIEHMPPRAAFVGKQRPKGLEFPACEACNTNTKSSDLVASMLARLWPDSTTDIQQRDIRKLLSAVANNIPELLREMELRRGAEKLARKRHNLPADTHPLHVGPLLNAHLETFAAKMGFALHYEVYGTPIPMDGGVQPMWFSNVQALNDQIPNELFEMLPSPSTLRQGRKNVEGQFLYSYALAERGHMLYFATFNKSFAIAGVTANDRSVNLEKHKDRFPIVLPGQFRTMNAKVVGALTPANVSMEVSDN
ncbi:hypothetical protein [Bradyrhizobium australafricanum]|uniref:hypothetical protein n=1 Tax=Bradyrhizobium australafricanum TaxID=2821406 RepID=UPI001CE350AA|nr:hypothetical protein [Bradyrhizobium australafricanum]MCA6104752.1 hypothetical protein [Bradyrhizobium australafricanum]